MPGVEKETVVAVEWEWNSRAIVVTCADAILTMPQPFERPVASSIITSALSTSPAVLKWSLSACHVT
jgi:hypothetical protein